VALATSSGDVVTAGELLASSNRATHGLRALGLAPGDAVAMVLPNCREALELYLAATQSGLYVTPINHHLTAAEIAYIVTDCEAKALFASARFAEACLAAAEQAELPAAARFSLGDIPTFRAYDQLGRGQPASRPDERTAGQLMQYTSGTTGRPKGVRRPLFQADPDAVAGMLTHHFARFGIEPGRMGVHLCCSPLYHTAPLMFAVSSLHFGQTVVLMERFEAAACLELIERHRVTHTHMVPTQFHRLLALPDDERRRYDLSSLERVVHAAAPCPIETKKAMLAWLGPVVHEYYGATEGGGTVVTPEEWLRRPGTVGKAWEGAEVHILDDDGTPCPPGVPGTVYMTLGWGDFEYYKDQEKTRANRRGNLFTVGDYGYLDEEGYLFLCDRKIDMIIAGGVNIYPAEIESVLLEHPAVGDVAVFGIPNDEWGEEVKAVVELAEGVAPDPSTARELLAFCAGRLARFKCPRSIDFVTALPRDPSGKLYKRKLRTPYWEGRERSV